MPFYVFFWYEQSGNINVKFIGCEKPTEWTAVSLLPTRNWKTYLVITFLLFYHISVKFDIIACFHGR